jgi:hypothetical protein
VVEHAYNVRSDLGGVWPAWLCREASAHQQKLRDTADLVIVGYLTGRGKRAALGIGSLLGAVYDPVHDRFRTVAKIGSGPSEQQWRELHRQLQRQAVRSRPRRVDSRVVPDVWVEPTYVIEVLADEVTRSPSHTCGQSGDAPGYALRFPRMLNGVRTDKAPEDATTEHEILELAGLQRKAVGSAHGARASRPRRGPLTRLTTPPQRRRVSQCLSPGVGRASSEHPVQGPSTHPSRGAGGPTTPRPNGRSQPFPPAARRGGRRGSRGLLQGKGRGRGEQGQQPALRQEG